MCTARVLVCTSHQGCHGEAGPPITSACPSLTHRNHGAGGRGGAGSPGGGVPLPHLTRIKYKKDGGSPASTTDSPRQSHVFSSNEYDPKAPKTDFTEPCGADSYQEMRSEGLRGAASAQGGDGHQRTGPHTSGYLPQHGDVA